MGQGPKGHLLKGVCYSAYLRMNYDASIQAVKPSSDSPSQHDNCGCSPNEVQQHRAARLQSMHGSDSPAKQDVAKKFDRIVLSK